VIRGRAKLPLIMGAFMGLVGVLQLFTPVMLLSAFFTGGFEPGMIVNAFVGAAGATLCFFLSYTVLSVPHPVLSFRADRLEVARLFGKFSTLSYTELKGATAQGDAAASKTPVRLRELSIPGWVMTAEENAAWQAELAARVPAFAARG